MRLDFIVASHLKCSPKASAVKSALVAGVVIVRIGADESGTIVDDGSFQVVVPVETVTVAGEQVKPPFSRTIKLNKPMNMETGTKAGLNAMMACLSSDLVHQTLGPIGRLDKDTTGLILLTTDGGLQVLLAHPASHAQKTYAVTLADARFMATNLAIERPPYTQGDPAGPLDANAEERFGAGLVLDDARGTVCASATLGRCGDDPLQITVAVSEGMNYQVRRMVGAVGGAVSGLRRVAIGGVMLGDLEEDQARLLTTEELMALAMVVPKGRRTQSARTEHDRTADKGRPTERNQRRKAQNQKAKRLD
jgi:16S rRNA pseudouridine516 synthase